MTGALVWERLGVAYKDLGDFRRAEEAFGRALAADPAHYYAAFSLGTMHLAVGRIEEARGMLRVARERAAAGGLSTAAIDALLGDVADGRRS